MTKSRGASFFRFVLWAFAGSIGLASVGYFPTLRLGGRSAVIAMCAGCAVSFAASVAGALPLVRRKPRDEATMAALMAVGIRFGVALLGGIVLALATTLDRAPLLIWLAVSHLALAVLDVRFASARMAESRTA
ncbi:MAG: hypothetical protein CME06_14805 [Gemmatimonadetes bacterium]|nr:hypothetical protein [Gemmatimonadota bacterium]